MFSWTLAFHDLDQVVTDTLSRWATVTTQIVPQKLKPSEGPTQMLDPSTRTTVAMCLRVLHSALQFEVVFTFDLATTRGVIRLKTHAQGFCAECWCQSRLSGKKLNPTGVLQAIVLLLWPPVREKNKPDR